MEKKESYKRRMALGAFANSVKLTGKFEWIMTIIIFMLFGGFITFFATKYLNAPDWVLYAALGGVFLVAVYIGYEVYLSRLIRAYEIKSQLENTTILGHIIEKIDRLDKALIKEMDIVIGIKQDVVKEESEKEEVKNMTVEKIQEDIKSTSDTSMQVKVCDNCSEEVYVAKDMELCPFCWSKLHLAEEIAEAESV